MTENKENKKKSRCNVQNCGKNPNVSLHQLPHEKFVERRQQWIKALRLPSNIRGKFNVCSDHFVREDFRKGLTQNWLNDWAVPSVNLRSKRKVLKSLQESLVHVESSSGDDSFCSFMNGSFLNSTANNPTVDEELDSDEIILFIDSDGEDEFVTDKTNETVDLNHPVKKHDCATQTDSKQYADKIIQINLAYDEMLKPCTFLDILHTESDLMSWTGLQRFVTLNNIVDCMMRLESAHFLGNNLLIAISNVKCHKKFEKFPAFVKLVG